jgi:hypothetical protein
MRSKGESHRICRDGVRLNLSSRYHGQGSLVESTHELLPSKFQSRSLIRSILQHRYGLLWSQNRASTVRIDLLGTRLL